MGLSNRNINRKGPPKAPKVPKGPKLPNFLTPNTVYHRRARQVKLVGGPWTALKISSKIEVGEHSLVISINGYVGYYRFSGDTAHWVEVENV